MKIVFRDLLRINMNLDWGACVISLHYPNYVMNFIENTAVKTSTLCFSPITAEDIPMINSLLQGAYSRTCDYTVGGIMMWVNFFGYEFCVDDGTLFIKGRTENNLSETAFMLPIGALPTGEAVERILEYCEANGISPVFSAVPEDRIDVLLAALPSAEIEPLEDWSDYIYDIKALSTFSGKHLGKKRNHFNQFVNSNPGWRFETIGRGQLEEVKEFFGSMGQDAREKCEMAAYEYEECRKVLDNYDLYPFEGALLRGSNGRIVAFAVGEVVGDTLFVHIEKMAHDVDGAGAAICKLFSAYMLGRHPLLRYVNREEDCGDLGLRSAKEQYHPCAILRKFNVRLGGL